jgi:hypothetical protein
MPNPARSNLYAAITAILEEIRDAPPLPLRPGGPLLIAIQDLKTSPSPATAEDVVRALGACAPHLPAVTNARLADLGAQCAIAVDRMQSFQRLAVEGVLGKN